MKEPKFNIRDESQDKKYFSLVPNYIVNHSTLEERGFYLTLKRIAGEDSRVYYSPKKLAELCGIKKTKLYGLVDKLLNRGWIEIAGSVPTGHRPRRTYSIVNIWKQNIDFYEERNKVRSSGITHKVLTNGQTKSAPTDTEEEPGKENPNDIHAPLKGERESAKETSKKEKCPNPKGHTECVKSIRSVEEEFGKKFANFAKQVNALHKLYKAGFTDEQINRCLNAMDEDSFWKENGWDLMNVVNVLSKGGEKYGI
jgi:DNA-binding PadR family transcriptional regulator